MGDDSEDAYVNVSAARPWPRASGPALLERTPAFMKETTPKGAERIRRDARKDLPEPVFVDPGGRLVSESKGAPAALIRGSSPRARVPRRR